MKTNMYYKLCNVAVKKWEEQEENPCSSSKAGPTFLSGADSLMSYRTILLSEAQLARSSVCGKMKTVNFKHISRAADLNKFDYRHFDVMYLNMDKTLSAVHSVTGEGGWKCAETWCLTSTGLNRTALKLSTPQVKERIGLLLCSSQMSTCWPHVANTASFWWWSSPVKTVCMWQGLILPEAKGDISLMLERSKVTVTTLI